MSGKVSVLVAGNLFCEIFGPKARKRLENAGASFDLPGKILPDAAVWMLAGSTVCITSWGTPKLTAGLLDAAPGLGLLIHAAGSVKTVAGEDVWERGIKVSSCAPAIGIGVAEHALGLMLSAMKRNYWFNGIIHGGGWQSRDQMGLMKEICGAVVGVIGAGFVGRHFIRLLGLFHDLEEVLVFDPYVSAEEARGLGAEKSETLESLIERSDIVSVHAPSIPETRHMLNRGNLRLLKDAAILINTARGSIIDEEALYEEAKTGRFTVCLDVTDPEPPAEDNPLRKLQNVVFTPHIAGAAKNNKIRIGNMAVSELERFFEGKPLRHEVRKEDLSRIA